jgi:predicted dehydrogenase
MKRRDFLSLTTKSVAASTVFPSFAIGKPGRSANSKLNIAFIGSGGWIARQPYEQGCKDENLVAFCDVDRACCAENMKNWRKDQPFFEDFRVMLDKMHKEIDAVVISTPDHTHFAATLACMERGIHVYTQKPLTHNIWQARTLQKAKHKYKVMTQMGNQGHAGAGIRRSVEAYRAGLIGEVTEVFAGNDGPEMGGTHFCNPTALPLPVSPIPDTLNWDLWVGPQAMRPFWSEYLPKKWRAVYDFGNGTLGDWGCHTLDTPVWALDLDAPTKIECLQREKSLDGIIPTSSHLQYLFPAKGSRGPVKLHWFDGPQDFKTEGRIDKFGVEHARSMGRSCWMVGSKGLIGCGSHAGEPAIMPTDVRNGWKAKPPAETISRVEGGPFKEWLAAIKGAGPEPGSNFDYASKLTEISLLGVLAQRFHTTIEWDAKEGKITNHDELNAFVKEPVREGWSCGEELWRNG